MAQEMKRVFHPTSGTPKDIPAKDVEQWKAAGWRMTAKADAPAEKKAEK